jgi:cell division protein FtsZ
MEFIVQDALKASTTKASDDDMLVGTANIKVVGAGGAGINMADWLYNKGVKGAEIIGINTDKLHLDNRNADKKILIGRELTRGLGCGGDPEKGTQATKENVSEIKETLRGGDMVFICAGMGGGTGTGSAPV